MFAPLPNTSVNANVVLGTVLGHNISAAFSGNLYYTDQDKPTLKISSADPLFNGLMFRCVVSDDNGASETSKPATLSVDDDDDDDDDENSSSSQTPSSQYNEPPASPQPQFDGPPTTKTVMDSVETSINAPDGWGDNYVWYRRTSPTASWVKISDVGGAESSIYSYANSRNLIILYAYHGYSGYQYGCTYRNNSTSNETITSQITTLDVTYWAHSVVAPYFTTDLYIKNNTVKVGDPHFEIWAEVNHKSLPVSFK